MESIVTRIINKKGLHTRAAKTLVQLANRFESKITLERDGVQVDGKSIMNIFMIMGAKGTVVKIIAEGTDEKEAVKKIADLISHRFGEDE